MALDCFLNIESSQVQERKAESDRMADARYQRYPHDLRVLIEQSALILEEHVLAELTHLMT